MKLPAAPRDERASSALQFIATRLLALGFLLWAGFYLLTALCEIANFAWRQPMFDQWRMYVTLLSLPFPQDILQLENGHRPIIPNLIRIAEIHWFAANQLLQISMGTCFAMLTAGLFAICSWRERALPLVARCAGVMLAALGVFWLANARMLLHGHEALHAYLVTLMVGCAGWCTWKANRDSPLHWLGIASSCCTVATFSFGSGVASFPAIILLGIVLRLRWRYLLLPVLVLALCLVLYLFVLPGDQGVRNSLEFQPLASATVIAQWLASPWANAWLGLANPPLQPWLTASVQTSVVGSILTDSAQALVAATGVNWQSFTTFFGAIGITTFLLRIAVFYHRRTALSPTQALAIALCLFVLATAAIIGTGRLDYLLANPGQTYADRYLMWPCLFWMGLSLLALIDLCRTRHHVIAIAGLLILVALPIVLLPTHYAWAGWGKVVYRHAQQSAAASRSDVFDGELFPNGPDAARSAVLQSLKLLKKDRLAMFADPSWKMLGRVLPGSLAQNSNVAAQARITSSFNDARSERSAAHIEGVVTDGLSMVRHGGTLAIVDNSDRIVGFAEFSFVNREANPLPISILHKRGFDGYIRDYHAGQAYRLVLLQRGQPSATVLAEIVPYLAISIIHSPPAKTQ